MDPSLQGAFTQATFISTCISQRWASDGHELTFLPFLIHDNQIHAIGYK